MLVLFVASGQLKIFLFLDVPMQASPENFTPEVDIEQFHVRVRCAYERHVPQDGSVQLTPEQRTEVLLDNELSGAVKLDQSVWTVNDHTLIIDLQKRPDYSIAAEGGVHATSKELRAPWWPCAVRGGKKGPEDPKAPPPSGPQAVKLDAKIGAQAASKKSFHGKSKFSW